MDKIRVETTDSQGVPVGAIVLYNDHSQKITVKTIDAESSHILDGICNDDGRLADPELIRPALEKAVRAHYELIEVQKNIYNRDLPSPIHSAK